MTAVPPSASYATKQRQSLESPYFGEFTTQPKYASSFLLLSRSGAQSDNEKSVDLHGQEVFTDGGVFHHAGSQQGCRGNTWLTFSTTSACPERAQPNAEQAPGATQLMQPTLHIRHANLISMVPHQAEGLASVMYHS